MTSSTLSPTAAARTLPAGRYGVSDLLRSEWVKLRTVRSTTWTLAVTVVIAIGIGVLATAETRAHWSSVAPVTRLTFDPTQTALVGVFFGQLTIGILGVLAMSGEYGSGTIRATFSAAPRRPLVLATKAAVFGAVALVVSELVTFVSYFVGQALLTAPATHTTLSSPGAVRAVVGAGLYLCVVGLFALGLAAIIRHTAGAIGAFVGVLLVLPVIIQALPSSISDAVRPYMPTQIVAAMISLHPGIHSFAPWTGFGLMCAYAAAALGIGGILLVRRDA
ncbi:MAG: ABC transporter permease subunit [Acidimicrobiales bacterium]